MVWDTADIMAEDSIQADITAEAASTAAVSPAAVEVFTAVIMEAEAAITEAEAAISPQKMRDLLPERSEPLHLYTCTLWLRRVRFPDLNLAT